MYVFSSLLCVMDVAGVSSLGSYTAERWKQYSVVGVCWSWVSPSWAEGLSEVSVLLSVTNNAAVSVCVQVCGGCVLKVLSGTYLGVGRLPHLVGECLTL